MSPFLEHSRKYGEKKAWVELDRACYGEISHRLNWWSWGIPISVAAFLFAALLLPLGGTFMPVLVIAGCSMLVFAVSYIAIVRMDLEFQRIPVSSLQLRDASKDESWPDLI